MMNELKELLNKGGAKVFTIYAVEIGDALWTALYIHVENNYSIESVCQEDEQIFAVLTSDNKYYRLNISVVDNEYVFAAEMDELTDYTPGEEPQFAAADVEAYAKKEEIEVQPEEEPEVCGDPIEEPVTAEPAVVVEEEVKPAYVLDEIPEYVELQARYAQLESELNQLETDKDALETQVQSLSQFKK
jgi:hypothetical protein